MDCGRTWHLLCGLEHAFLPFYSTGLLRGKFREDRKRSPESAPEASRVLVERRRSPQPAAHHDKQLSQAAKSWPRKKLAQRSRALPA
jgi:hypothetical protein